MPMVKPLRQCNKPGCLKLTKGTYCEDHKPIVDEMRPTASQRGYNYEWQKYRLIFLTRNPLCVSCLSRDVYTAATVVDHIKDHKGNVNLFWNEQNHQSLCKHCHDVKTGRTSKRTKR